MLGSTTYSDKPEAFLEVRSTDGTLRRYHLDSDHALIGRSENADVLLEGKQVSRIHAELVHDPFGRWWVRDLSSRNGIRVNGEPVREQVLRPGDLIRIWEYYLTFHVASFVPTSQGPAHSSMSLPVSGVEPDQITTVSDMKPVKVDASHLHKLMDVGDKLLDIEDGRTRLRALCKLMVTRNFHGRVAAALRMNKQRPDDPPEMLCELHAKSDELEELPYISRSVLKLVREQESALLASNVTPGGDVVGLSLAADVSPMSAVVCPVRTTPRILDILYVVLPPEYGTPEWLALTMLAVRLFQQGESAWVARRQSQAQAVISGELERASKLQRQLLPVAPELSGVEVAIGFEPCRWIGGDYVDVLQAPDGRVFLMIADVSGKGLPAALMSSSLHTMVHAGLGAGLAPDRMIDQLNVYLCDTLPDNSFVTAVAAMLDPQTGELETVNCGHPPAMVFHPDGGSRRLQVATNLPLGIDKQAMVWHTDRLETGQMLAFYTDGLTELVPQGSKQMLGMDQFARRLERIYVPPSAGGGDPQSQVATAMPTLESVADRLSNLMAQLNGPRMASDDRTFLLARLRGE